MEGRLTSPIREFGTVNVDGLRTKKPDDTCGRLRIRSEENIDSGGDEKRDAHVGIQVKKGSIDAR
jgi:hypothetical protein